MKYDMMIVFQFHIYNLGTVAFKMWNVERWT